MPLCIAAADVKPVVRSRRSVRRPPAGWPREVLAAASTAPVDGFVSAADPAVYDAGGRDVRRRLRIRLIPRRWRSRARGRGPASNLGRRSCHPRFRVGSLQLLSEADLSSSSPAHRERFSEFPMRTPCPPAGTGAQRSRRPRRREDLRFSARAGSYTCSAVSEPCQRGSAVRDVRVQCALIPHVQATSATP